MDLTNEQKRALADLTLSPGYTVLLTVLDRYATMKLDVLATAKDKDSILEAAMAWKAVQDVIAVVKTAPKNTEAQLKEEGDILYA
jgi:hypothetical protein